jgi:tol-pal system protein YbgF
MKNKIQGSRGQGVKGSRKNHSTTRILESLNPQIFIILSLVMIGMFGCASTEETTELKSSITSIYNEFNLYREETDKKLSNIVKEDENIRKQFINLSNSIDSREDNTKIIMGKLDELEHQLRTYWNETKSEINLLKKGGSKTQIVPQLGRTNYEAQYKEAFDTFQKGMYEDSIKKFSEFIESNAGTPLIPNAYYWIGESYIMLKNYEKAILYFQEIIDKYPKSEKAPRALLLQAQAFNSVNDKKSSITILKRVIELFPKTEEAVIAERKLRALNLN